MKKRNKALTLLVVVTLFILATSFHTALPSQCIMLRETQDTGDRQGFTHVLIIGEVAVGRKVEGGLGFFRFHEAGISNIRDCTPRRGQNSDLVYTKIEVIP